MKSKQTDHGCNVDGDIRDINGDGDLDDWFYEWEGLDKDVDPTAGGRMIPNFIPDWLPENSFHNLEDHAERYPAPADGALMQVDWGAPGKNHRTVGRSYD